jgi:hypothetical protein
VIRRGECVRTHASFARGRKLPRQQRFQSFHIPQFIAGLVNGSFGNESRMSQASIIQQAAMNRSMAGLQIPHDTLVRYKHRFMRGTGGPGHQRSGSIAAAAAAKRKRLFMDFLLGLCCGRETK